MNVVSGSLLKSEAKNYTIVVTERIGEIDRLELEVRSVNIGHRTQVTVTVYIVVGSKYK